MNSRDNISISQEPDRIALATRLVQHFGRIFISRHADIRWIDILEDPLLLAEKACIVRQHEALRAALVLNENGIGHLAVGFVRPACEEYIWLGYLNSIDRKKAGRLLLALNLSESARSLEAQRKFMGADEMVAYGFPAAFLSEIESWPTRAKTMIKELARELDWPGDKGRIPSAEWFASQSGSKELYDFLYSATSRMLHFSPSEISRRTWGEEGAPSVVKLDHPDYVEYRLDFALDWQIYLFARTLAVLKPPSGFELDEHEDAEMMESLKAWADLGKMPLLTPEEMNLTLDKRSPW
jgi:hypothetical protein